MRCVLVFCSGALGETALVCNMRYAFSRLKDERGVALASFSMSYRWHGQGNVVQRRYRRASVNHDTTNASFGII